MFRILMPLLACAFISACIAPIQSEQVKEEPAKSYRDSIWQDLYDLGDERSVAGVMAFLSNPNPELRSLASRLAGSIQDSLLLPGLHKNLSDTVSEIQIIAAWSIGQIANPGSTGDLFKKLSSTEDPKVKASIYEAIGKCISTEESHALDQAPTDSIALVGWLKGWYRLVLRDRSLDLPDEIGEHLLSENKVAEIWALHIFSRNTKSRSSAECLKFLDIIHRKDSDAPRMTAIASCKNCELGIVENDLLKIAYDFGEYELIRINAVRSLRALEADATGIHPSYFVDRAHDYSLTLAKWYAASDAFECEVLDYSEKKFSPEVHATLVAAAAEKCDPIVWGAAAMDSIQNSRSDYSRMFYLRALPYSQKSLELISSILDLEGNPRILSTCADKVSAWGNEGKEIGGLAEKILSVRDAGATASIANFLKSSDLKIDLDSNDFNALLSECVLPREVETYNELVEAKNHLFNTDSPKHVPEFNHPIDWKTLSSIEPDQNVRIQTSKGDIVIKLKPEIAPGTVADFLRLADEGYFRDKTFHRVVPNFVIQGGCPRGDGWGSQDYTIRSEFSELPYIEGTVGMASAGPDTESCQWFITHSATPHLEGRYTIFAYVTEGMNVVNRIQVGDKILAVALE